MHLYLIKRFTIVSFFYKGDIGNNPLKIKCDIHVKAASTCWMECSEDHRAHTEKCHTLFNVNNS